VGELRRTGDLRDKGSFKDQEGGDAPPETDSVLDRCGGRNVMVPTASRRVEAEPDHVAGCASEPLVPDLQLLVAVPTLYAVCRSPRPGQAR